MKNDEKKCPLTKMTCYGEECGMWADGKCAATALAETALEIKQDVFWIRKAVEENWR